MDPLLNVECATRTDGAFAAQRRPCRRSMQPGVESSSRSVRPEGVLAGVEACDRYTSPYVPLVRLDHVALTVHVGFVDPGCVFEFVALEDSLDRRVSSPRAVGGSVSNAGMSARALMQALCWIDRHLVDRCRRGARWRTRLEEMRRGGSPGRGLLIASPSGVERSAYMEPKRR